MYGVFPLEIAFFTYQAVFAPFELDGASVVAPFIGAFSHIIFIGNIEKEEFLIQLLKTLL